MQINLSEALNLLKKGEIHKSKDICEKILKKDKKNLKYFKIKRKKLYFDLTKYVQALLLKSKIYIF